MARTQKYDTDGGGRRYELVKSALQGGCPEMLKEIEKIIQYIDSGDDSYLMGAEAVQAKENQILTQTLQELQEENERLKQDLERAKELKQEINDEITKIVRLTATEINDNHNVLEEYFGKYQGALDDYAQITGALISNAVKDSPSVYVMVGNRVHRVQGVYKHQKKSILEISENGYLLKDEGNGINTKSGSLRKIEKIYDLRKLGSLRWY